ncbi:MAG: histidinol-phosphate transaminase [Proteobacteria bacterium]|nr:histidinol-phosphate transaminase [Pseudomonadota bacterium]
MSLADLVNPHIRELQPYQPGKPVEELERELGIRGSIKLASNEAPLGPSPLALEALEQASGDLNRYPEDDAPYLKRDLAKALEVSEEQILCGSGSDELLDLLGRCFLGPDDEAVFAWPSFAMYPIVAKSQGARAVQVPLDGDLRTDVDRLAEAVGERTRILFLSNPNNPTGTSIGRDDFERLLRAVPERVVIVSDEAYHEYVRREDFPLSLGLISRRPTLVVLRTFSKVYGLAGLRVGYGVGDPELISLVARARHPFNVNTLAQAAARGALSDPGHVGKVRDLTHRGLERLESGLRELGLRFAASDANFLLVEVGDGAGIYDRLLRRGVITRPMAGFGLQRHIRVTVGLPEENQRFLDTLAQELSR